jgi:hypothetical protein
MNKRMRPIMRVKRRANLCNVGGGNCGEHSPVQHDFAVQRPAVGAVLALLLLLHFFPLFLSVILHSQKYWPILAR